MPRVSQATSSTPVPKARWCANEKPATSLSMKKPLVLCAALLLARLVVAAPATPNILWLIAEDMGPEALSRSNAPEAYTPTIDRLAKEGVFYEQAHPGMVCSVSRSSFMTGMYATSIGAHNHRTPDKKPLPEGVRVLTEWMRDAGYYTANVVTLPPALAFKGTGKTDWN